MLDPGAGAGSGEIFGKLIPSGTGTGAPHNCQAPRQGGWKGGRE